MLERATTAPPAGAIPFRVTVPVELFPPTTVAGLKVKAESVGGFTVMIAVRVFPALAEIVTTFELATALVVTVKLAVVAPGATVTLAGTWAAAVLLLESVTVAPPAGAAPVRVTVPVELFPPMTVVGLTVTEERVAVAGVTVRVADCVVP